MGLRFEITNRDEEGRPTHVCTFDGFAEISRPFDPETDGWMEDQLEYADFPEIRTGRRVAALVDEVNHLRRENFRLSQNNDKWMQSAGFGKRKS